MPYPEYIICLLEQVALLHVGDKEPAKGATTLSVLKHTCMQDTITFGLLISC